jgi:hypothetical protein
MADVRMPRDLTAVRDAKAESIESFQRRGSGRVELGQISLSAARRSVERSMKRTKVVQSFSQLVLERHQW